VVAARLGIPVDNVDVVHGDTGRVPFGMGTYGSRSISVGGAAIMKALDKIETKAKKIAAHLMEASDADIEFANGEFTVKGTDKKIPFGQVALTAYVPHNYPLDKLEPGLNETAFYDPTNFTFPGGTYICEVEIDKQTAEVRVDRFTAVDDFGTIINPMIVEGQVHGGLVQGIGQALLENCVYDNETGQLLTGSFMDYAMPRAAEFPQFKLDTVCTPCTHNPLGTKGCGEAGAIGSPPAVINAVLDALAPLGVKDFDMPASSSRVWEAMQKGSGSAAKDAMAQQPALAASTQGRPAP
jgi:carbon-monoxide dehydrogenase large subunit